MFSALRQGGTIYILNKTGTPELKIGQVIYVSNPMPRYATATPGIGINTEMVIDIKAKDGEQEYDFKQLPSTLDIANYGNTVVSDTREAMLSEVDNMRRTSQQVISQENIEYHEKVVGACDDIFKTLNPSYAKEQERDEAISSLSERLDNFEKVLGNIETLLSKGKS